MPLFCVVCAEVALGEQQCENMQGPMKGTVVSKMGHNEKIPKAIIHTSKMYGGLELRNIHVKQGMPHTMFVTQHARAQSETTKIMLFLLETCQLRTGIDHNAVINTEHVAHAEALWIIS